MLMALLKRHNMRLGQFMKNFVAWAECIENIELYNLTDEEVYRYAVKYFERER